MVVLSVILGVLLAICGVSMMCTPLATFMETGYFLAILIIVYGVMGIVKSVAFKQYGVHFLFSIISVILGLLVALVPGMRAFTDGVLLYIVASWFILQGLVSVFMALNAKRIIRNKMWIWGVVIGIIGILLGIYSFIRPLVLAVAIGMIIGFYFIETGVNLIIAAIQSKN